MQMANRVFCGSLCKTESCEFRPESSSRMDEELLTILTTSPTGAAIVRVDKTAIRLHLGYPN